jgi:hypothetical protein
MNKHFEDTRYYLKRAGETAKRGVTEELEPIKERFQDLTSEDEPESELSRLEEIRADLKDVQERAEGEAKEAIEEARNRIDTYREDRSAE